MGLEIRRSRSRICTGGIDWQSSGALHLDLPFSFEPPSCPLPILGTSRRPLEHPREAD